MVIALQDVAQRRKVVFGTGTALGLEELPRRSCFRTPPDIALGECYVASFACSGDVGSENEDSRDSSRPRA